MHSFSKIEAQKMNSQNFGGGESIKVFKNGIRFYIYVLVPHSFFDGTASKTEAASLT